MGFANLVGAVVVVVSFTLFGVEFGIGSSFLFLVYKVSQAKFSGPAAVTAPVVPVISRPTLPEGSVRSRYSQGTIQRHNYDLTGPEISPRELREAIAPPIPLRVNSCCAITASLISFFYEYSFNGLTPFQLDALLARGVRVDDAVRTLSPELGTEGVDIIDFFAARDQLEQNPLPFAIFDPEREISGVRLPNEVNGNKTCFQNLLQTLSASGRNQSVAGMLFFSTHYTGIFIQKNGEGEIEQIYASESRDRFCNNLSYDSGGNAGAIVARLGNTFEEAASHLAHLYKTPSPDGQNQIYLFPMPRG